MQRDAGHHRRDSEQIDRGALNRVGAANLKPGESLTLDDGTTITFSGYKEFAGQNRPEGYTAWFTVTLSQVKKKTDK